MSDKPKIIKQKTLKEIEKDIYDDKISLARNIFRWLKKENPEKAKEVLKELQTEAG